MSSGIRELCPTSSDAIPRVGVISVKSMGYRIWNVTRLGRLESAIGVELDVSEFRPFCLKSGRLPALLARPVRPSVRKPRDVPNRSYNYHGNYHRGRRSGSCADKAGERIIYMMFGEYCYLPRFIRSNPRGS